MTPKVDSEALANMFTQFQHALANRRTISEIVSLQSPQPNPNFCLYFFIFQRLKPFRNGDLTIFGLVS